MLGFKYNRRLQLKRNSFNIPRPGFTEILQSLLPFQLMAYNTRFFAVQKTYPHHDFHNRV